MRKFEDIYIHIQSEGLKGNGTSDEDVIRRGHEVHQLDRLRGKIPLRALLGDLAKSPSVVEALKQLGQGA